MSGVGQLVTSGPLILALPVAAAAGAVTFLSPCCLPLVPGYLSFVTGMAGADGSPPVVADGSPPVVADGAPGPAGCRRSRKVGPRRRDPWDPRARMVPA